MAFCKDNITDNVEYDKAHCLLLGFKMPVLNIVMLCCKYVIHLARLFSYHPTFQHVLPKMQNLLAMDLLSCRYIRECSRKCTYKIWRPLSQYQFPC